MERGRNPTEEDGRYILGHWYKSNNGVVMNELGWMPLKDRRDMLRLRYWRKLLNMDNRRKVKQVYEADRKSSKKVWAEYTKELLYSLDLAKEWDTQHIEGSELQWNELLLEKFRERVKQKMRDTNRRSAKLKIYNQYIGEEEQTNWEYLKSKDLKERSFLARLRSNTNELRMETARTEGLDRIYRACKLCICEQEDEEHFLQNCQAYRKDRETMYREIDKVYKNEKNKRNKAEMETEEAQWKEDKMHILVGNSKFHKVNKALIKFIKKAKNTRDKTIGEKGLWTRSVRWNI